ncbi:MAG TPA: KpsF/GutQ family sugar-phosphate isomerase [Saprospiraceae bacterium]|nr:KpsF/GutQ family sugar-phosphate isomerase [Saprospiraceae bacterium]
MKNQDLIYQTAIETIRIELAAIEKLPECINDDFINSVHSIFKSSGRLVITGIGKSAIVGQKIVATLNSTGTPSLFMHAADAIHGDLGMIQKDDCVLCLSKSGETPEIKILVPLLKNMGNIMIAMVSAPDSYLALHADYVLLTPTEREADPNNLAPTTSTTLQMIMGDAIATSLLALKGFTRNHFAKLHPGGALGKQLYLRVESLVERHEMPKVMENSSIREVIMEMTSKRLGATAVINKQEQLVGVITDGDLRRMLEKQDSPADLTAKDIMNAHPRIIQKDELAVNALEMMRTNNITQLVVLEDKEYIGMIHLHDLVKEGLL